MNGRNLASGAAAALVSSLLMIGTTSEAQPGQPAVVIEKHYTPATQYVTFADLSLATRPGQKVLYHRVSDAVRQVCPRIGDDGVAYDTPGCMDTAWYGARPQINQAIARAQAGVTNSASPMAMTIAISATDK